MSLDVMAANRRSSGSGVEERELIQSFTTNHDGRLDSPALKGEAFLPGLCLSPVISPHTSAIRPHPLDHILWIPHCISAPGVYEWVFQVGDYFARSSVRTEGQPFLDMVPLRFGIDNPELHYHVPLLCSPWSYSTYRGS